MDPDETQVRIARKAARTTIYNYIIILFIQSVFVICNLFGMTYKHDQRYLCILAFTVKLITLFLLSKTVLRLSAYMNNVKKIQLKKVEKNQNVFLTLVQTEMWVLQFLLQQQNSEDLIASMAVSVLTYCLTTQIPLSVFSIIQRTAIYTINIMLSEKQCLSKIEIMFVITGSYGFLQQNQLMFNSDYYPTTQFEHLSMCKNQILNGINELTYTSKANFIQESQEEGIVLSITLHQINPMLQHISQIYLYIEYLVNDLGGSILQMNTMSMDVIFKANLQPAQQQQSLAKVINLCDLLIQLGEIYNLQIGTGIAYGTITKRSVRISVNNQLIIQGKSLDMARQISKTLYNEIGCAQHTFKRPNCQKRNIDKYYFHEINKLIFEQNFVPNFHFKQAYDQKFLIIQLERPVNLKKASYDYTYQDRIFSLLSIGDYSDSIYETQPVTDTNDRLERSLNDSYSGDLTNLQQSCTVFELQLMHALTQQLSPNLIGQQHNCSFEVDSDSNKVTSASRSNIIQNYVLNTSVQEDIIKIPENVTDNAIWGTNNRTLLSHYISLYKNFRIKNTEYAKIMQANEQLAYNNIDTVFLAVQSMSLIILTISAIDKYYIFIHNYFKEYKYNGVIFTIVMDQHQIWKYFKLNCIIIIVVQIVVLGIIVYKHIYSQQWFNNNYSSIKLRQFTVFNSNIAMIQLVISMYYIIMLIFVYTIHSTMQYNNLEIYQQNGNFLQIMMLLITIQLNGMRQPMMYQKLWLWRTCMAAIIICITYAICISQTSIYISIMTLLVFIVQLDDTFTIHFIQLCNMSKLYKIKEYVTEQFEELHKAYTKLTLTGRALQYFQHFPQLQKMFLKGSNVKYVQIKQLNIKNININDNIYLQLVTQTIEATPLYIPIIQITNVVFIELSYDNNGLSNIQEFQQFLDVISKLKNKEIVFQNNIVAINNKHLQLLAFTYQSQRQENLYKLMINCLNFCFRLKKETDYKFVAKLSHGNIHGTTLCRRAIQFSVLGTAYQDLISTPDPQNYNRKVYTSVSFYNKLKQLQQILYIELQLKKKKNFKDHYNFKINVEFEYYGQLVCFLDPKSLTFE